MKRTTIGAALAASLLAGTSAFAQHDDRGRGGGQYAAPQGGQPQAPARHEQARPQGGHGGGGPRGNVGGGASPAYAPQYQGRAYQGGGAPGRQDRYTPQAGAPQYQRRFVPQGGGAPNDGRHDLAPRGDGRGYGERDDRGEGRPRYDQRAFPRSFRPEHPYRWRGETWREPRGYYDRHWGYGDRLPWGWIGPRWFIDDYYDYDLPVPPWGFEWIRVGPDALLIDLSTGMVVEAAYGLFYY